VTDDQTFVPAGFDPPVQLTIGAFRLEPLGPEHNDRDYAAWTSSTEYIRSQPSLADWSWPHEMSLAENLGDLEHHARDFAARKGFTYTVLDADDDVVGCVYVYPADDGVHDALVRSWLRQSVEADEAAFRQAVTGWLTSDAWPFRHPLYAPLLG
jgi:hypothetical protein